MEPAWFCRFQSHFQVQAEPSLFGGQPARLEQDLKADIVITTTMVTSISVVPSTAGDYRAPASQAQDCEPHAKAPRAALKACAPLEETAGARTEAGSPAWRPPSPSREEMAMVGDSSGEKALEQRATGSTKDHLRQRVRSTGAELACSSHSINRRFRNRQIMAAAEKLLSVLDCAQRTRSPPGTDLDIWETQK